MHAVVITCEVQVKKGFLSPIKNVKFRAGWRCTCPSQASFSSMMQKGPHPRSRSPFMIDLGSTITDSGVIQTYTLSSVPFLSTHFFVKAIKPYAMLSEPNSHLVAT